MLSINNNISDLILNHPHIVFMYYYPKVWEDSIELFLLGVNVIIKGSDNFSHEASILRIDSFIWHLLCHQTPAIDQIQEMVDLSPSPVTVQNQIITGLNLKASCLKNENQISPLGY